MVARAGLLVLQTTEFVTFLVEPSVKVPVAVYWRLLPTPTQTTVGVTEMEARAAGFTVSSAELKMEPTVAVMEVWPGVAVTAIPALLTVATAGLEEVHVAVVVKSRCDPSL